MTEQETVAPPSGKRTEVSAPDRRNAATAVELVEPADLEELRRLAEAATPGPWKQQEEFIREADPDGIIIAGMIGSLTNPHIAADAAYIAAANPAAILALLDRFAALQDELEHLREDPYQNRHIDAEQRVAALEDGLRMMVEVFADGSGVHSAAAAYCTLSDEGHASIAKARALLSEGER